jgi:hypothetical protein
MPFNPYQTVNLNDASLGYRVEETLPADPSDRDP